jgi:hypothetical protein
MREKKHCKALALGLALSTALITAETSADNVSGKQNLVCAANHIVGCTEGICMQGHASTFDIPTFMFIDFQRKMVLGVDEAGKEIVSPIKSMETTDRAIILQGFENHHGWTMGIDRQHRHLTMSSTGADVNFIITGECTER